MSSEPPHRSHAGPLAGLRVLEVARDDATALCGRLLADLGAEVVAVGSPGRAALARGKRHTADADGLAERAHVVLGGAAPNGVACRIPAFPGGHPRAEVGDPREVPAAAGLFDPPIGRPRAHDLGVATTVAALWAATAAVAGAGGPPRTVEVPLLDAALSAHELGVLLTWSPPRRWEPLRWASSPLVKGYRCADGRWLYLHAGLPAHLDRLVAALRDAGCDRAALALNEAVSGATRRDPVAFATVGEARAVAGLLAETLAGRPAMSWEEALGSRGVCAVVVRSEAEWREHPQPWAAGQWVRAGHEIVPGPVVTVEAECGGGGDPLGGADDRGPPLAGVRVVDASQVIAGPVAGRALAALGADVVKVVNPRWDQGWVEAFRAAFDAGKRLLVADLATGAGREALARVLGPCDAVVHNLRAPAAARCGLDDATLAGRGIVRTIVTAYGSVGPWGGRPGWEQTAQAAVGTQHAYGGDRPELVPLPVTDVCTGLAAALGTVAALRARRRGARAPRVEAALTAAAILLRDMGQEGEVPVRRTGHRRAFAARPHLVRRAAGVSRVALPVRMAGFEPFPAGTPVAAGSTARWIASTATWAAWAAWSRR